MSLAFAFTPRSRDVPTRRAHTFLDSNGERTITTIGERLAPRGDDPLDWPVLDGADGVYFTAGDGGALRAARRAKVLVATPRAGRVLAERGRGAGRPRLLRRTIRLESDLARELETRTELLVATSGAAGGRYEALDGSSGTWAAAPLPGPVEDTYGCGDSFAAALTFGLAQGQEAGDALALAARAGACCITGRGPYGRQLTSADL